MTARLALAFVLASTCTAALGGGFQRSANFDVLTPTVTTDEDAQNFARTLLERAEHYRKEVALTWLGEELPPSVGKTMINVSYSDRDYGLTWAKDDPQRKYHTLYLSTTPDRALNHTLAHEMVHVILATRYPHPNRLPAWLEEGIASRYDDPARIRTREQIVAWWANTGNWPNVNLVLDSQNISGDDQTAYATAASLADFLLSQSDAKTLLAFGDSSRDDFDRALRAHYGINDRHELQRQWQAWVIQQRTALREAAERAMAR